MSRKKRTSAMLKKAEIRAAGLQAVDANLSFDETRNLQNLNQMIEQLRDRLTEYNAALAIIDSSKTEIGMLEKNLGDLVDQMLVGVAFRYGKNSSEYERAGGVRKSERIRRSRVRRLKGNANNPAGSASQSA